MLFRVSAVASIHSDGQMPAGWNKIPPSHVLLERMHSASDSKFPIGHRGTELRVHIHEPTRIFRLAIMLLLLSMACEPAAAPGQTEPDKGPAPQPTVDPAVRAVGDGMECSPSVPGEGVGHDHLPSLPLEKLIDGAAMIVHARGLSREQARVPDSDSGGGRGRPKCLWVVYADLQVYEYLKGEGPETIRVTLPVTEIPRADRPLAMVQESHDVEEGNEYVLFLQADRITPQRAPDEWTWSVLFESHGRWPLEGERLLTRLEPPDGEITLDELRTAIFPLGPGVLPTVGPLGRAVGEATECSSNLAEVFASDEEWIELDTTISYVRLPLEDLIDEATLIVHVRGGPVEQVSVPDRYSPFFEGKPVCEWMAFTEVEVKEYLKGEGTGTIRVALKVSSGPLPDRPLVRVEDSQEVREGHEYVLFLRARGFPDDWGLSGRTWALFGGWQGRWPLAGEISRTRLKPPLDEMTLDELRAVISR